MQQISFRLRHIATRRTQTMRARGRTARFGSKLATSCARKIILVPRGRGNTPFDTICKRLVSLVQKSLLAISGCKKRGEPADMGLIVGRGPNRRHERHGPATFVATQDSTAEQQPIGVQECGAGHRQQAVVAGTADGMANDTKGIAGHAQHAGHQFGGGDEAGGHDADGWNALSLGCDRVVQTAR